MEIFRRCDDGELARSFGWPVLERGRDYADRGRVVALEVSGATPRITLLTARVRGSGGRVYGTNLTVSEQSSGLWVEARCSCPVGRMCKHAAAVLLAARAEDEETAGRDWERRLSLVLDELDDAVDSGAAPTRPLGLLVELPPVRSPGGWPGPSLADGRPDPARGTLRVRPVQRGRRDTWVRSRLDWSDAAFLGRRADVDPAQAAVLAELYASYQASSRGWYHGTDQHLSLPTFGVSVWGLLAEAERVGVALVPAGELATVAVAPDPLTLRLDVNGADTDRAHLSVGVEHDGAWFSGGRLEVLGADGHGVALWTLSEDDEPRWHVTLGRLTGRVGDQTRRLIASGADLPVPREDVADLVADYLPRLRRHLEVVSSDSSVQVPEEVEPRLALTLTWKAADEVHLAWSWRYRVGADDRVYGIDESRGLRGVRRRDREAALLAALRLDEEQRHRLCGTARHEEGAPHRLVAEQLLRGHLVVPFVEDTLEPLAASGQVEIEEIGGRPDFHELTDAPVVRFEPRDPDSGLSDARTDWLDLEVVVTVGGRHLGLARILEALTLGADRIVLPDGAHLRIDRPELTQLAELVKAARELEEQPSDGVRVSRHDLGLWAELDEIGLVDAQASRWARSARALRDLTELPAVDPVGVQADLRHYQLEGFRWLAFLWRSGLGGILADDMGLGKTLQTLALMAHARAEGSGPFLVVAPTSVVGTWAHEAETFVPGLTVRAVTESRSRRGTSLAEVCDGADVVVTSYTLYRLEVDDYVARDWGGLVLDEAQTVKNHQGKTYQCVRRLEVPFRLALTGTPLENRLLELWSLLSIVAPGLYPYPQRFTEHVANPVEKEGDAAVLARFRRRIRPFLLRRTKELVASDLPPKQEQVLEVRLTPRHRKVYQTHLQRERQKVLGLLGDFDRQRMAIFRSLTRLRQLSLDAALVDPEYDGIGSAKVDALVDHLQEVVAEGHRALVFSQFTSFLTRVRARLDAEGISSQYLDGRTRRRGEVVRGFKAGQGAVFLISLKAGGVGLTLTEADYVFVLDPWWNPAVEAQAVDRAHRIGQQRPVIVYRLVAVDTIEEKVMELKARKAALFADVVDGDGSMAAPIGADDVRGLFEP
jgi:superfamily II DNA or RNA helicase